jgi:acyl-CoA thioesterase FadM
METARIQYYRVLGLWKPTPRLSGPSMAKANVEYKLPLTLEDNQVVVYTRCANIGGKSYEMQHQIIRHRENQPEVAAIGLIVLVSFDYHIAKSIRVPDEWRAVITAYEPLLHKDPDQPQSHG